MKLKILYHGTDLESAKEICGGNIDVKKVPPILILVRDFIPPMTRTAQYDGHIAKLKFEK